MADWGRDGKFIYYKGKGTELDPDNPAVRRIMSQQSTRMYLKGIALQGSAMFTAIAKKGKHPNPQRNSTSVRIESRRIAVASQTSPRVNGQALLRNPDRWAAFLAATAPHALAREFGWTPKRGPKFYKNGRPKVEGQRAKAKRRKGGEGNLHAVARAIEKAHYRPKKRLR